MASARSATIAVAPTPTESPAWAPPVQRPTGARHRHGLPVAEVVSDETGQSIRRGAHRSSSGRHRTTAAALIDEIAPRRSLRPRFRRGIGRTAL